LNKACFIVGFVLMSIGEVYASDPCAQCPGHGEANYAIATLLNIDYIGKTISIGYEAYYVASDRGCDSILALAKKDCGDVYVYGDKYDMWFCTGWCLFYGGDCQDPDTTDCANPCDYDDSCGSYCHGNFSYREVYSLTGKGELIIYFGGAEILCVPFDFTVYGNYGSPTFNYIEFLNKNYSQISNGDIFDAMESVAIKVGATWEEEVAPAVQINLCCDATGVEITVEALLIEANGCDGDYRLLLPPGALAPITGDPDDLPPGGTKVVAQPTSYEDDCEDEENAPEAQLEIVDYFLTVEEISFVGDHNLVRDSAGVSPPIIVPIVDPVWRRDSTENEPAAYVKDTDYSMAVVVKNIYTPLHDFEYKLMALGRRDSLILDTEEQTCHLAFSNYDTITNISPRPWGRFPDCVGIIDSLSFQWAVDKCMLPRYDSYRFITASGPHKIYLTYDKPKLDPAHTLALDKICKYAQGQSIDTVIAERGVMGVYGEGWTYNPNHQIFGDPLNVIRHEIGQCGDYANLMTALYKSIGLISNPVIIYNGLDYRDTTRVLFWLFTEEWPWAEVSLLSNSLRSCDGTTVQWQFSYHAVCHFKEFLCDASLGLFRRRTNYGDWWRYYIHPRALIGPFLDNEPPTQQPVYYDWPNLVPSYPSSVFPRPARKFQTYWEHP
jgi:hypothetical protein